MNRSRTGSIGRIDELERRLRDEAAQERPAAPAGLVERVLVALATQPAPRAVGAAEPWSWAWLAAVAALAVVVIGIAVSRDHDRRPAAPFPAAVAQSSEPAPPLPALPSVVAAPAVLIASTDPLHAEWRRVDHDASAACRFLLECMPSAPRAAR